MICPTCRAASPPGGRFCAQCGASLAVVCSACGERAQPGAGFCSSCGSRLGEEAPAGARTEERKIVTVLFADLVDSTAVAERLDPEDVRARLALYHAGLRQELERFGGTVEKFIGDAIVALFGAPVSHEDDPERAVRAALAIHEAIARLNESDPALELEVRIGVHTGEALVSLDARPLAGEAMAAGDVMNTAARLQSAAPPGGVLVGEPTFRATRHAIDYREAEPVRAKGKSAPVPVWEVAGVVRGDRLGHEGPLVGRGDVLDLLVHALARVRRERATQLVTIVGGPGIGKSRLVRELAAADVEPDAPRRLQGRSLPYGEGSSFGALAEVAKAYAGILETDSAAATDPKLRRAVEEAISEPGEAGWVIGHLRPLVGLASPDELRGDRRAEAFAAWRRLFEGIAARGPLALVLEDLQWADDGLLDFVDHLVDWAGDVPMLVVATMRPELLERRPAWGGRQRNAFAISLSPLSESQTSELVAALLDGAILPADVQAVLLERAGGNPLYAGEYVRMLADRGFLRRSGAGGPTLSPGLPVPETVQGIIAARLDALQPEDKELVKQAAVIGQVFWVGALAAIARLPPPLVEARLHTLERKEFVRRERVSSVANERAYAFLHVLVRDVAYGQIARARRAENHRLAAEWIESLAPDRSDDRAEMLAHHYLSALSLSRAAGRDEPALSERARRSALDAAAHAAGLDAHAAAVRFYRAALELTHADDESRPELLLRLGEERSHAEQEGAEELVEARAALLARDDRERAAVADVLLASLFVNQGLRRPAQEHLRAAAVLLDEAPPSRAKAFVLSSWSRFLMHDRTDEGIAVGREALAMAEQLGLDDLRAYALNNIGRARLATGDEGGLEDFERSLAIAVPIKSLESVRGYRLVASTLAIQGKLERAFEVFAEGRRAAERFGDAFERRWLEAALVIEDYWLGRWTDAVRRADAFVAESEAGSRHYMESTCHRVRGLIRLARGDVPGARDDAERGVAVARAAKDLYFVNQSLGFLARTLAAAGEPDAAGLTADELLALWAEQASSVPSFEAFDVAIALRELDRGSELARVRGTTPWLAAASAFGAGDFARAAHLLSEIGSRADEAFARLQAGRAENDETQLERARAFFSEVGASAYLAETESLLVGLASRGLKPQSTSEAALPP
jgi:class 3 adenylate cyclase